MAFSLSANRISPSISIASQTFSTCGLYLYGAINISTSPHSTVLGGVIFTLVVALILGRLFFMAHIITQIGIETEARTVQPALLEVA